MLKWAVGQRNPTPGPNVSSCSNQVSGPSSSYRETTERLHVARRRNSRGAVRKAAVRSLKRIKDDKENQPCLTPENVSSRTRDSSRPNQMALRDVSNYPDTYTVTPTRHNFAKRRQSHPLNLISKHINRDFSKSAPTNTQEYLKTYNPPECNRIPSYHLPHALTTSHTTPEPLNVSCTDITDTVDMRKPNSTLKSLLTMQIEYSPGPLTATQSLVTLRQRLTKSLTLAANGMTPQPIENPLYCALNQTDKCVNNGITISCSGEQSPTLEAFMEEKSIFEQVSDNLQFITSLKKENSRPENTLVSSLSERLEWLRLNNSFNGLNLLKEGDRGEFVQGEEHQEGSQEWKDRPQFPHGRKRRDWDFLKRQKSVRRKIRKCCDGACRTGNGFCCDKNSPKTQPKPKLMGLTLPLGVPSPIASEDSGLYSLGLEGIHPLSSSPVDKEDAPALAEEALTSGSLSPEKCSPSSICSSLRKRVNEEGFEGRDAWSEEVVPLVKTPKLANETRFKEDDQEPNSNCDFAFPSPLALVEKRSRSRRCLRFVSPGSSTCQRHLPTARRPLLLSCPRLRDGREGPGDLELSVNVTDEFITVHVGRGVNLSRTSGTGCNAYVKVALVPSTERTFFRTPVHRESSCPNFNEKFSFKYQPEDLNKQILVSVWHRDRDNRKSEFLGCVSLAVKNAIKKEISGSFRLVAQSSGSKSSNHHQSVQQSSSGPSTSGLQSMMARHSGNAILEEIHAVDDEGHSSPEKHGKSSAKKKLNDDSSFLRHLELEPLDGEGGRFPFPEATAKGGRTPFTTTKQLTKQPGAGFGFSIAWVQPPRVERVEAGQSADKAGIRPGDFVVFVDRYNVVTMSEDQILQIIKSCGNELTLEIYRKSNQNGVLEPPPALPCPPVSAPPQHDLNHSTRWSAACSAATSASFDYTKRRLHLPQVAFTNEVSTQLNPEESRKKAIYQLLNNEQNYAINLQFGINRFLIPLTERREFLNPAQHHVLFQNVEEILRLTEETLDQVIQGDLDTVTGCVGRLYFRRIPQLKMAYRRYCAGLKRADCLLAEKSKDTEFNRFCAEPSIPRKCPDLTTFLHKPLEHYRELLKLHQTVLNLTKASDPDHLPLSKLVSEMQTTFREVTAGFMEPEVEGRPLLSVQDLESRLVFTRCKPFVLNVPGRQWIFGGDLSRVEGRTVHPFWALLFTDMMVFAKVSRDRVLFVTEEPLSLLAVSQASFNIRKRANEFRLLLSSSETGTDSPANAMCGPDIVLSRTPKKNLKFRSIALRAPTPELKAVWQNLIQRQIIYLNTTRGLTPAGSPLDSPDQLTTLSAVTLDSLPLKRQGGNKDLRTLCLQQKIGQERQSHNREEFNEFIDHRCKQLSQTKTGKDSAYHLAEWMKDHVANVRQTVEDPINGIESNPRSDENRCRRTVRSNFQSSPTNAPNSKQDEYWTTDCFTDTKPTTTTITTTTNTTTRNQKDGRQAQCSFRSQKNATEKMVPICRQCHDKCLKPKESHGTKIQETEVLDDDEEDDEDCGESWGPLMMLGMCGILPAIKNSPDPFAPLESPKISVLPPTPDKTRSQKDAETAVPQTQKPSPNRLPERKTGPCYKVTCKMSTTTPPSLTTIKKPHIQITKPPDAEDDRNTPDDEPPHKTFPSSSGLRRFGTLTSLEKLTLDDPRPTPDSAGDLGDIQRTNKKNNFFKMTEDGEGAGKGGEGSPRKEERLGEGAPREMRDPENEGGERGHDEIEDKIQVKTNPQEMSDSIRGWTVRAGSFVAAKMAFFERLNGPENSLTVRKTTFLERYFKPSGENNFEPGEMGTNTSSSGRGEEEGETSGATSGEEVWGTPTSAGDFDDELHGETSTISIFESPRGSIGADDETEHLMEDLLINLPMLAMRTLAISPRRRLEPLLEEYEELDGTSAPCPPKPAPETKLVQVQDRNSRDSSKHQPKTSPKKSETLPRKSTRKDAKTRAKSATADRHMGSYSDDDDVIVSLPASGSFLRKLGLKKTPKSDESPRKTSRIFGFLSGKKMNASIVTNHNSATYGAKPLFRYLFNRDSDDDENEDDNGDYDDDIPTAMPKNYAPYKKTEKHFWNHLRRKRDPTAGEVPVGESK